MKPPAALRPYLVSSAPNGEGEWGMHCPLHDDEKRSASINPDKGAWYCFSSCGGGTIKDLLSRKDEWLPPPQGGTYRSRTSPKNELSERDVARWHDSLVSSPTILDRFMERRGLTEDTIDRFLIGWNGRSYTIPVYNMSGRLINVRGYNMGSRSQKFYNVAGDGSSHLYPIAMADESDVLVITEGELDALIAIQAGTPAITRTSGARQWNPRFNQYFEGKKVIICQDRDDAGTAGVVKIGSALMTVAAEVRVAALPYPHTQHHGKDITDFFIEGGGTASKRLLQQWRTILSDAQLFDASVLTPEVIDPSDAEAIDAMDAGLFGKPLRLTLTVRGKANRGFTIPRQIEAICDRSAGPMCKNCPLFGDGDRDKKGQAFAEIESQDPIVLRLIGVPEETVGKQLKALIGIPPRCPVVTFDNSYQSVEILYARPSVDHVRLNGRRVDYTNLRITSVGRHNTPSNSSVQVIGAVRANPNTQETEFQAWDVSQTQALEENFEVDRDTVKALRRFRNANDQSPLDKVLDIADWLAAKVTHIYGRPLLHAALDLVWHSVLQFEFMGQLVQRGWLELLVVGDTRTGKSEVARNMSDAYRCGEVVSCEAASFAGVVGGVQQMRNEWALTWGIIPINDRRLVVLDEVSGLTVEEIGSMSSVRSSGIAAIEKVVQEKTPARTRLIWMGNPRDDVNMSSYTYGVYAIRPLIGRAEDIARFDLATTLTSADVDVSRELAKPHRGLRRYRTEDAATLVRWAWTREPEDVIWQDGAQELVLRLSNLLGARYTEELHLVIKADIRNKLARAAVAMAARTYSTRDGNDLWVTRSHVRSAYRFMDMLYSDEHFGYKALSDLGASDMDFAETQIEAVREYLGAYRELAGFLLKLADGRFYARDLEEVLGVTREQANGIINRLITARMIRKDRGAIRVMPPLLEALRGLN